MLKLWNIFGPGPHQQMETAVLKSYYIQPRRIKIGTYEFEIMHNLQTNHQELTGNLEINLFCVYAYCTMWFK